MILCDIPFMWNLKRNDTNKLTYKTEVDSQTWRRNFWLSDWKGEMGEGIVRESGMHMYTLLCLKRITQQGPTVQHREICSMLCSSLDGRGVQGRISLVQLLSHVRVFVTPGLQHAMLPCPSPTPRVYSNSCPSRW